MPTNEADTVPEPLDVDEIVEILDKLGVHVEVDVDEAPSREELVLSLAHGLIGAVEAHAIVAESAARNTGLDEQSISAAAGNAFSGAACAGELDAIALLQWRITRTLRAVQALDFVNPEERDPLAATIVLTMGALAGLLATAIAVRNPALGPEEASAAAESIQQAVTALDRAQQSVPGHQVLTDLLGVEDTSGPRPPEQ